MVTEGGGKQAESLELIDSKGVSLGALPAWSHPALRVPQYEF